MTYETLILPKEFFETQLYIELPYEYLDHLEDIAQNNNLTLWKPGALKLWIEDRKQSGTPICIYKTNDDKLCCCSKWWAEQQHETHGIIIAENFEKMYQIQLQQPDILDLL